MYLPKILSTFSSVVPDLDLRVYFSFYWRNSAVNQQLMRESPNFVKKNSTKPSKSARSSRYFANIHSCFEAVYSTFNNLKRNSSNAKVQDQNIV